MYIVQERAALSNTFDGCTNMEKSPIILTNYASLYYTFNNCSSLSRIDCLSTKFGNTSNFTQGVAQNGVFKKTYNASWETGVNGIPEGWTVESGV